MEEGPGTKRIKTESELEGIFVNFIDVRPQFVNRLFPKIRHCLPTIFDSGQPVLLVQVAFMMPHNCCVPEKKRIQNSFSRRKRSESKVSKGVSGQLGKVNEGNSGHSLVKLL